MPRGVAAKVRDFFRTPVTNNDYDLTPREKEVLEAMCDGKSKRGIAEALHISEHTVNQHAKALYRKLEVHSKSEAVSKAFKERLIS